MHDIGGVFMSSHVRYGYAMHLTISCNYDRPFFSLRQLRNVQDVKVLMTCSLYNLRKVDLSIKLIFVSSRQKNAAVYQISFLCPAMQTLISSDDEAEVIPLNWNVHLCCIVLWAH